MGNSESRVLVDTEKYLNQHYEKASPQEQDGMHRDYRFGNTTVWKKKPTAPRSDPQQLLVKEKWSMNEPEFRVYKDLMTRRKNLAKQPNAEEHLCKLMHSQELAESSWCSKYYKNCSAYEYHSESLAEELRRRKRLPHQDIDQKYFKEPELWYVMRVLSGASTSLKTADLKHGDVQPRHLLIVKNEQNPDEGGLKVIEQPLIMQYFTGFDRMLLEGDYHAAISPEQMKVLRDNKDQNGTISPDAFVSRPAYTEKDEVYSLGITQLCASLNNPLTDYYDYDKLEIKENQIAADLDRLQSMNYSPEYINTIRRMLVPYASERCSLDEVNRTAHQYTQIVEPENLEEAFDASGLGQMQGSSLNSYQPSYNQNQNQSEQPFVQSKIINAPPPADNQQQQLPPTYSKVVNNHQPVHQAPPQQGGMSQFQQAPSQSRLVSNVRQEPVYLNNNQASVQQDGVVRTHQVSTMPQQQFSSYSVNQQPSYITAPSQSRISGGQTVYAPQQVSQARMNMGGAQSNLGANRGAYAAGTATGTSSYTPLDLSANYDRIERDGKVVYVPKNRC